MTKHPTEANTETWNKGIEQEKEMQGNFRCPDLLMKIKEEFNKDHIGDDRNKLFLFCSGLSGRLPPYYRFSSALIGDSSEGKDNMWNTTSKYLPKEWYLEANKITGSCIEDDIDDVDIIYFKEINERGMNYNVIDHLKALVEDGITVMKKDVKTNFKETIKKEIPRKVGIYSTTSNIYDEELANRYCLVTVKGHPSKYKAVNVRTKAIAENVALAIGVLKRKEKTSWITTGLKCLKKFDVIIIPNASIIEERTDRPRTQRDLKRFLNLVRVIAWLHQKQRKTEEMEDYKILHAEPEDVYNAMEIGSEIFNQSYSQLDGRSKDTLQAINTLIETKGTEHQELLEKYDDYESLKWIDRVDLQKELNLKSTNSIKNRVKKLKELGIVREHSTRNACFITLVEDPSFCLSSTYHLPISETFLGITSKELYDKLVIGKRQANDTPNDRQKTALISFEDSLPISNNKINDRKNRKKEPHHGIFYYSVRRLIGGCLKNR